jgi:hypothetical protein
MTAGRTRQIPIFTDNDVPDSVGTVFADAGHDVVRLRDCMPIKSADAIVEAACRASGRVLVTHNYRDFRRIAREQAGMTKRDTHELCRIELLCPQLDAARRVLDDMEFIELAWERFLADPTLAMCVAIGAASFKFSRGPEIRPAAAKPKALSA